MSGLTRSVPHSKMSPSNLVDEEDRKKIIQVVVDFFGEEWASLEDVKVQRMADGRSNRVMLCSSLRSTKSPGQIIVRLYNTSFKEASVSIINSAADVLTCFIASETRISPRLIGVFDGGRLEEYVPSYSPTADQYEGPAMFKVLAEKVAQIHSLEVPFPRRAKLAKVLDNLLAAVKSNPSLEDYRQGQTSSKFSEKLLSVDFDEEIEFIKPYFDQFPSKIVFCHNDLNRSNILIRNDRNETDLGKKTLVIDFENASYGCRWSDFVVIFAEVCFSHWRNGQRFSVLKYPNRKKRAFFAKCYIQQLNRIKQQQGKATMDAEDEIELLETEVSFGIVVASLINILWRLSHRQIHTECEEKNLWEEAYYWLELYYKRKSEFQQGLEL